jgi:hypothetical protein
MANPWVKLDVANTVGIRRKDIKTAALTHNLSEIRSQKVVTRPSYRIIPASLSLNVLWVKQPQSALSDSKDKASEPNRSNNFIPILRARRVIIVYL